MPIGIPAARALACAAAVCSATSHCTHTWKSTRVDRSPRSTYVSADRGSRNGTGQVR